MKKLLAIICLAIGSVSVNAEIYSTNLVGTVVGGNNGFLLLTNRASIYSVEVTSPYNAFVRFFDASAMVDPGYGTAYVNAAYSGVASYATNYVTSYIGQNGFTNWFTNAGIYTYSSTVAANTNRLNPAAAFVVAPNTYAVYNTDALLTRGLVVYTTTNVTMVINYRSGK